MEVGVLLGVGLVSQAERRGFESLIPLDDSHVTTAG